MALTRKLIPVGKAGVQFEVEGDLLHTVILPKKVPANFDQAALDAVLKAAARYRLAVEDASAFTQSVWQRMRRIPAGKTSTYGALGEALGKTKAARAIGGAVGRNKLLIVLPCHRVLAKNGLGGFRAGLDWKRKLLELEQES